MAAEELSNDQGFEADVTVGMKDVTAVRSFKVDGSPLTAVYDPDLPEIGEELPGWSGAGSPICLERKATPISCEYSKVICRYSKLIPGDGFPDETGGEEETDEVDMMTQTVHIKKDLDGNDIGQHGEGADIDIPKVIWTATRYSASLNVGTIVRLVSRVNEDYWNGGGAREWKFLGARALRTGSSQWRITMYFARDVSQAASAWANTVPSHWHHRAWNVDGDGRPNALTPYTDHRVFPDGDFNLIGVRT